MRADFGFVAFLTLFFSGIAGLFSIAAQFLSSADGFVQPQLGYGQGRTKVARSFTGASEKTAECSGCVAPVVSESQHLTEPRSCS